MLVHRLSWGRCEGGQWCNLFRLDLSHQYFQGVEGVYVIWSGGEHPRTLYVGQGSIAERLTDHRRNLDIPEYRAVGLFVTWAEVPNPGGDLVERHLADRLQPALGERHPEPVPPPVRRQVEVNLPW